MKEKYFLFTFENSTDDIFGVSHTFVDDIALPSDSVFYDFYNKKHLTKQEITSEEYDEWVKNN